VIHLQATRDAPIVADMKDMDGMPKVISRRSVIKGVIAAGAVSSAGYLFRSTTLLGQASAPGSSSV